MSWKNRGHESIMLISLPGRTFKMSIWNGLSFRSVHFKVQSSPVSSCHHPLGACVVASLLRGPHLDVFLYIILATLWLSFVYCFFLPPGLSSTLPSPIRTCRMCPQRSGLLSTLQVTTGITTSTSTWRKGASLGFLWCLQLTCFSTTAVLTRNSVSLFWVGLPSVGFPMTGWYWFTFNLRSPSPCRQADDLEGLFRI